MRAITLACSLLFGAGVHAQTVEAPFAADYRLTDLGPPAGVPSNVGGLTLRRDQPNTLYVVGASTQSVAGVYRIGITRDEVGHIVGLNGSATLHAAAPHADGGLQFGPGGVLFFTRYNMNELGQIRPGSSGMDKSIPLFPLGILPSVGGLAFVPWGHARTGELALLSNLTNRTYSATLVPDGAGTFDIATVTPGPTLSGGIEGYVYVPPRSPGFTDHDHVLLCEWGAGVVSTFELDDHGDPDHATRQVFLSGVPSCIGAVIDPLSGDLLISIYGGSPAGTNHVFAVRGFGAWRLRQFDGTPAAVPDVRIR